MRRRYKLGAAGIWLLFLVATGDQEVLAADCGESVPAPKFSMGDKWVSRNEKGGESTREAVGFEGDLAQVKWTSPAAEPDKEGMLFIDPDGVARKAIRPNGEVVTKQGRGVYASIGQRTLDFPLQVGKRWDVNYIAISGDMGLRRYKVEAREEVSTAAGKFSALRIEVDNRQPRWSGTSQFCYAPAAKGVVKVKFGPGFGPTALDSELVRYELK